MCFSDVTLVGVAYMMVCLPFVMIWHYLLSTAKWCLFVLRHIARICDSVWFCYCCADVDFTFVSAMIWALRYSTVFDPCLRNVAMCSCWCVFNGDSKT